MSVLPMDAADEVSTEPVPPTRRRGWPTSLRRPAALLGVGWLAFLVIASFTAPLWRPYEVDEQDLAHRLEGPSAAHWLGTDPNGRDILSRIFTAGVEPLLVSTLTVLVAFGIGIPLALMAAQRGRRTEQVTSRLTEIVMALPSTILLLAVIGVIGVKIYLVMGILGVLIAAAVYRIMLGVAQSVRQRLYVDAARVSSSPDWRSSVSVRPSRSPAGAS
jgi:peptide/nickel transport system permease protein